MAGHRDTDVEIRKIEESSLKKFKNQNAILKKFGKSGLRVYRAIRKRGISLGELMEKTRVGEEELLEIIEYLEKKKMVERAEAGKAGEKEEEEEKPPSKRAPAQKKEEKEAIEEETAAGTPEERGETEKAAEEEEAGAPPVAPGEETAEEEGEKEEESAAGDEVVPDGELVGEDDILPELEEGGASGEEEEEKAEEPAEEESGGGEEEEDKGRKEAPEEKEGESEDFTPLDFEGGEEEAGKTGEEEEEKGGEIAPERGKGGEEEEEEEDIFLSPGERKIKAKYGETGIEVYNLIDGQRTAEEIMKDTGVTEKKLIEMLDFMEKEGIIKLEHPGSKKAAAAPPKTGKPAVKEVGFAPMLEESGTPERPLGGTEGQAFTLDVPSKLGKGVIREMQAKANLLLKFKKPGVQAFELINGKRDEVEIALSCGLPLFTVYRIIEVLEKDGLVKSQPSSREEIKRKYGDDGYSVYKRYGREGIMLYQLIGKDMDLREMADKTSEDKKRIVEIFMFIHKLLGIELPIDEDVLLERLQEPAAKRKQA